MKTVSKTLLGSVISVLLFTSLAVADDDSPPSIAFGLPHTPLGATIFRQSYGYLEVYPDWETWDYPEAFGVSVSLGESDCGIWGELSTGSCFWNTGNYMEGHVYGRLNGVPDTQLGWVRAETLSDWGGPYAISADYSPLGSASVTYELFNKNSLVAVASSQTLPAILHADENSPRINPFYKLPDGSVVAVIEMSALRSVSLPTFAEDQTVQADRIVIRPDNCIGVVDFASRVDLWAGGGESYITVSQEFLGMFNRKHKALGNSLLQAAGGNLTIARQLTEETEEIGVSVLMEPSRHFNMQFQPVELNEGNLRVSAIGARNGQEGEYFGYAEVQNQEGFFSAFADFEDSTPMRVSVFLGGTLMASEPYTLRARIGLSGNPHILGAGAIADMGAVCAGFGFSFDQATSVTMPDGTEIAGDEIRFQLMNASTGARLKAVSVTFFGVSALTITRETGAQSLSVLSYFPEVVARGSLKRFTTEGGDFGRSASTTNVNGHKLVVMTDRQGNVDSVSATYSFQEDGLYFHGHARAGEELFSSVGLRILPEELAIGQSYFSMGTFEWKDTSSGVSYPAGVSCLSRVAGFDAVRLSLGLVSALRVESATSINGAVNGPTNWLSTNWLVEGVGVLKFAEAEAFADGTMRTRSGEVTDYVIVNTPLQSETANVGANIEMSVEVITPGNTGIGWRRNGELIVPADQGGPRLNLNNLQAADAGLYAIEVAIAGGANILVSDIAFLNVIPFSDTPPFWAALLGAATSISPNAVTVDNAGNAYVAGSFRGDFTVGNISHTSRGDSDGFIAKMLPSGEVAWVRTAGGSYADAIASVATDSSGNVYIAGGFAGTIYFGSLQITSPPPRVTYVDPLFVAKLDANGNFLWASANGGNAAVTCAAMASDASGNLYIIGGFSSGSATFGNTALTNTHSWATDMYFTKLNSQGQFLWAKKLTDVSQFHPNSAIYPAGLKLDSMGNVLLAGTFRDEVRFDDITLRFDQADNNTGFLVKADPDGHYLWAKTVGMGVASISDDPQGNVYVTGQLLGSTRIQGVLVETPEYWGSTYLAKFGSDGTLAWARLSPHKIVYYLDPMVADSQGNLYVTGDLCNGRIYDGATFTGDNTVVSKLDPLGRSLWNKQIGGTGGNRPCSMGRDTAGNVYLAGIFSGRAVFGETSIDGNLGGNAFLVKITGATGPTLTQQPQPQTVNPGESASFSVMATGTEPLSYQWRKNEQGIIGANSSTLSVTSAGLQDAGDYSVMVKNAGGIVISASASLQVNVPDAGTFAFGASTYSVGESNGWLYVTVVRTGNTSVAGNVELITVDGSALAGEDYWNSAISVQFAAGETSKTIMIPVLNGAPYELSEELVLLLCNPGPGATVGQQATATVTILDDDVVGAPAIRVQPVGRSVMVGQPVAFGVVAEGVAPLLYQWRKDGVDIPDATSSWLSILHAKASDAGNYSVVVRNDIGQDTSLDAYLTVLAPPDVHFIMFGLTNRPLGQVNINTNNGMLEVTPRCLEEGDEFGVSVTLGEADSGVFGTLGTGGAFQSDGNYTAGYVFGQLNGVPEEFLCSLKATTVDWYSGRFAVETDFSPLSPASVTCQVFNEGKQVASFDGERPFIICTYSSFSPVANPFMRLPDGTIAAVIELSGTRQIEYDETYVSGDRVVIRAENPAGVVDFVSRVDARAGGGEDLIVLSQERLGMFNRSHLALGDSVFKAQSGQLTVAPLHSSSDEIGTAIALAETPQFKVQVQHSSLEGEGTHLMASAVAKNESTSDFMGYVMLRNAGDVLEASGSLPCSPAGMEVLIYRNGAPVATVDPTSAVTFPANAHAVGFEAAADNGLTPPWLAVQLDRQTTIQFAGGSVQGDQIRFRAISSVPYKRLNSFSLSAQGVAEFTITSESGFQPIALAAYVPEILMPQFLKRFSGGEDGSTLQFTRSATRTNVDGSRTVLIADRTGETTAAANFYSAKDGAVRWLGRAWGGQSLTSGAGLLLLPDEMVPGQSYIGQGSFLWQDTGSAQQAQLEVQAVSKLNWEPINVEGGQTYAGLRLETVMTFSGGENSAAPANWRCTNWLAPGIGVMKFFEIMTDAGGQSHHRWGELTDCVILKTTPQNCAANVGASIILKAETVELGQGAISEWQKDGAPAPEPFPDGLHLDQITQSDTGTYSVMMRIAESTALCPVATLRVLPFSDSPPFWAAKLEASYHLNSRVSTVDSAGNVYVGGNFSGNLGFGTNWIASRGGSDIFLAKFDSAGRLLWGRTAGGVYTDSVSGIGLDADGNVYLTGSYNGTATFGPFQLVAPPSTHADPAYVTKLDPNGTFLWAVGSTGNSISAGSSIVVDSSGTLTVLGYFYTGTLTFGNITVTNNISNANLFLAKLDNRGQCLWVKQGTFGGFYPSTAMSDGAGGVYLSGQFHGPATLGQISLSSSSSEYYSGFLTKVDSNGNFLWAKALGYNAMDMAVDSAGNVCVLGEFYGTVNFSGVWLANGAGNNSYLAKFAPDGVQQWARLSPAMATYSGHPLVTDSSDNLYMGGTLTSGISFDGMTFNGPAYNNTILCKLDSQGRSLWNKHISGPDGNSPGALAHDNAGNVYLVGDFRYEVIFGETSLTAANYGGFVVKITGATAPTLTQQPQPQTVNLGAAASFAVSATGTDPLRYQWRKNGQAIPGANNETYTVGSALAEDAGAYSVEVKNAGGIAISDSAALQVMAPDAGTVGFSAVEYAVAENNLVALVTVLRTGDSTRVATVELRTSDDTALAGLDYVQTAVSLRFAPGETVKTVSIPILYLGQWEPTEAFAVALGAAGAGVTLGQPALALVRILDQDVPGAPVITVQPRSYSISEAQPVSLYVVASGGAPLSYQWRKDGVPLEGATNHWLTFAAVQTSDAGVYSVLVRNNVAETTSAGATLAVLAVPVIVTPPQNQTIARGETVMFSIVAMSPQTVAPRGQMNAAPNSTLSYRWQKDGHDIYGATGPTLTITPVNFSDQGTYTVIVTEESGGMTSSSASLNVVGPRLYIERLSDGQLQISWKAPEYQLLACEDLVQAQWEYVSNSTIIVPASGAHKFYGLFLPEARD